MSSTVLHIDASARFADSASRAKSSELVASQNADTVIRRDLTEGLPFLDETFTSATFTPEENRTEAQKAALAVSDELVAELQAADTIVIGTAMYNFAIPAVLKAWIDQIARAGVTFAYTENGPKGLLEGKKAIITIATGGTPLGSDYDFASNYLRFVLGFVGITDVTILDKDGNAIEARAA
ncbi:FMN-dependent NADH-azoreductase [Shimia isoporae]|uniref:FMN dependent NADH:quinone oxidoreductase n=1 Tax=Shimia isoporae TaxID=647720 RepID=A0A4R1NSY3_9RHOB|nr:NAD(P)H-dependent oxidoreductase [Shimia isoporae]TCL08042.1 FMN-dependent NADH-azoreductase [Shimia isoporae]